MLHVLSKIFQVFWTMLPDGCVFLSKNLLRSSSACGVNDVRRLRFFDGSLPINSVRFCIPFLYRSSASCIHRSRTGFIFCALFGVMSSFSNLVKKGKHNLLVGKSKINFDNVMVLQYLNVVKFVKITILYIFLWKKLGCHNVFINNQCQTFQQ